MKRNRVARVTISLPARLLGRIDARARRDGLTRSAVLADLARREFAPGAAPPPPPAPPRTLPPALLLAFGHRTAWRDWRDRHPDQE